MLEATKEFIFLYELNLIFRIIVACLCGVVIGFERKSRAKYSFYIELTAEVLEEELVNIVNYYNSSLKYVS